MVEDDFVRFAFGFRVGCIVRPANRSRYSNNSAAYAAGLEEGSKHYGSRERVPSNIVVAAYHKWAEAR